MLNGSNSFSLQRPLVILISFEIGSSNKESLAQEIEPYRIKGLGAEVGTHRLGVLVADEPSVQLGAGDLELAVQVVGRLLVGVGHLEKIQQFEEVA